MSLSESKGARSLTKEELQKLSYNIIGACMEVHKAWGPGLLERIYHECLCYELDLRGIRYQKEYTIPLSYKGRVFESALRADLLVEDSIVVEIKSVSGINPIHKAQLISYLRLANKPCGILVNFNEVLLKDGLSKLYPSGQEQQNHLWSEE